MGIYSLLFYSLFSSCFCSSLFISSFSFFFCGLMVLICLYPGFQVYWPMSISVCFELIIIQVQVPNFYSPSSIFCNFDVLFYIFMLILLLLIIVIIALTIFLFFLFMYWFKWSLNLLYICLSYCFYCCLSIPIVVFSLSYRLWLLYLDGNSWHMCFYITTEKRDLRYTFTYQLYTFFIACFIVTTTL